MSETAQYGIVFSVMVLGWLVWVLYDSPFANPKPKTPVKVWVLTYRWAGSGVGSTEICRNEEQARNFLAGLVLNQGASNYISHAVITEVSL